MLSCDAQEMHLVRLAIIGLSNPAPPRVLMSHYLSSAGIPVDVNHVHGAEQTMDRSTSGDMTFSWPRPGDEVHVAVSAVVSGLDPEFSDAGNLIVPTSQRQTAERAIEEFADMLSIAYQCRRVVRSPETCLIIGRDFEGEFGSAWTLEPPSERARQPQRLLDGLVDPEIATLTLDRMVGARILASALSGESPIDRGREFIRFFESAFGVGFGAIANKLGRFLSTSPYESEFTKQEVQTWVGLRGPAMHADRRVAFSVDLEPYLLRMEWAAYDVFLHKRTWGTTDPERRPGLAFVSGWVPSKGLVVWGTATLQFRWLDSFGVYDISRIISPEIPDGFVSRFSDQESELM